MARQNRRGAYLKLDAAVAGPLLMLSAALLFTMLNVLIKLLGPQFRAWDIGFYRFCGGAVLAECPGRRNAPIGLEQRDQGRHGLIRRRVDFRQRNRGNRSHM